MAADWNDKTGHRQRCKSSIVSLTQSVGEALKGNHLDPRLPKFDAESGDNVHEGGGVVAVGLHRCQLRHSKETGRRSISGVTVMLGNAAVHATSCTQHCATLSTTEAECLALAEGAKEGMFVRLVMPFIQPNL